MPDERSEFDRDFAKPLPWALCRAPSRSASGAFILTVLRLLEGIGVGGELDSAVYRSAPSPQPSSRERGEGGTPVRAG